ncbi:MAG: hypothetical protein KC492_02795, partial [Myxococcales bacterium]|nr:hypothetical protein [Myxococcales bacterium]
PYNVRELEAAVKRCVALVEGDRLDGEHLPPQVAEAMQEYGNRRSVDRVSVDSGHSGHFDRLSSTPSSRNTVPDEQQLRDLLRSHAGNIAAVGRELGKARMQIHRWMKRYNIEVDDYRG